MKKMILLMDIYDSDILTQVSLLIQMIMEIL